MPLLCLVVPVLSLLLAAWPVCPFSTQSGQPVLYRRNDTLLVLGRALRSTETAIPYDFYSVPHCRPTSDVQAPTTRGGSFGDLLWGDPLQPTALSFTVLQHVSCQRLCSMQRPPDTEWEELELLKFQIDKQYRAHLIVDNLPVSEAFKSGLLLGYSMGSIAEHGRPTLLHNHLDFTINLHKLEGKRGYHVTGFHVRARSVRSDLIDAHCRPALDWAAALLSPQELHVGSDAPQALSWSYSVRWVVNKDVQWRQRWDPLLTPRHPTMHPSATQWGALLLCLLALPTLYVLHGPPPEAVRAAEQAAEGQGAECDGQRTLYSDILRAPAFPRLFVVLVSTGCQLLSTSAGLLAAANLGAVSAAKPGSFSSALVLLLALSGPLGGFASARCAKAVHLAAWRAACLTALVGPAVLLLLFTTATVVVYAHGSSIIATAGTFARLLAWWLVVDVPLVLGGAAFELRWYGEDVPVATVSGVASKSPRHFRMLCSVALPALMLFTTAMPSLLSVVRVFWSYEQFDECGWLAVEAAIFLLLCMELSVLLAHRQLRGDSPGGWWWGPFLTSGMAGLYQLVLFGAHFLLQVRMFQWGPALLYFGWTGAFAAVFTVATGTAMFLPARCFVSRVLGHLKP
eukprot:GGOE01014772.1.p1 GENE.GGOE01014772.1~~GGOE01014772.1.p1  ORF type:complete len:626 (+),score=141.59 GGOE01014772.1:28-1905(+)